MPSSTNQPTFAAKLLSAILDLALFNLALLLGLWLHGQVDPLGPRWDSFRELAHGIKIWRTDLMFPYTLLLPVGVYWITGIYNNKLSRGTLETYFPLVQSILITCMVLALAVHFHRGNPLINQFPTTALILAPGFALASSIGWRLTIRSAFRVQERIRKEKINLLIVGLSGFDEDTYARITKNEFPNYNVVGYLEGMEREEFRFHGSERCLGPLKGLGKVIEDEFVSEVLVMPSALSEEEFLRVVHLCELRGVDYRIVPSYFDMVASRSQIDLVNYVPLIYFGQPTITGWSSFLKRTFDIFTSLVGLAIFSPLLLLLGLLIMLDSRGPTIFRQNRVGKGGRLFKLYKFRTMIRGSELQGALTMDKDPRITRVGQWLRRWSLDELPQLLNVLKGDMSIVGPRAVVPFVVEKFNDLEKMTLNILPGITGLAQVSGRDAVSFRDKSMLNIYYIRNYSFLLDMKIIARTLKVILEGEGNI